MSLRESLGHSPRTGLAVRRNAWFGAARAPVSPPDRKGKPSRDHADAQKLGKCTQDDEERQLSGFAGCTMVLPVTSGNLYPQSPSDPAERVLESPRDGHQE